MKATEREAVRAAATGLLFQRVSTACLFFLSCTTALSLLQCPLVAPPSFIGHCSGHALKHTERELARTLRQQGCSLNEILQQVGVSKSSLSLWVRDIELTAEQIERLRRRISERAAGREVFRQVMRARRDARWALYRQEAVAEYEVLSQDPHFMFGLALYVGEGAKAASGHVAIVNCEPGVIVKGLEFFEKIGASRHKIAVSIHLHPGLCAVEARNYWQQITALPLAQFHETVWAISRASQRKKGNLQLYGTCHIAVHSVRLRQKLEAWMNLSLYDSPQRPGRQAV